MPLIPDLQLQEILHKSDMAAVMGDYVTLKPAGMGRLKGLCPFHGEKTPSFHVDVEKGFFKCFGCGEGGNLFKFLMLAERLSFQEAAQHLAMRCGVSITIDEAERRVLSERERWYDLMERAVEFYQKCLQSDEGRPAREYLNRRGIGPEVVDSFRLGYAPSGARLCRFLTERGYTAAEAAPLGLVRLQSSSGHPVDYFYQRLMFPIVDLHARPIALGGRLLGDGEPKYLNSPETSLFSKGRNLYGLSLARTAMGKTDQAIVVEGYMDTIALHQYGFPHTVGTLGTALTEDQARLLRRYAGNCVLSYDGDTAGRKAAERGIPIFEAAGLQVKVLTLPEGEDPDTLARKLGTDGMAAVLKKAPGVVDFLAATLARRLDIKSPEGKSEFFRQMAPTLLKIQDDIRRNDYIRRYAERLGVAEESARRVVRQAYAGRPTSPISAALPASGGAEEALLSHLLHRPDTIERARVRLQPDDWQNLELRDIYERLLDTRVSVESHTAASILALFPEEGKASRVTELLVHARGSPLSTESLDSLLSHFERRRKQQRLREVLAAIEAKLGNSTLASNDPLLTEKIQLTRQLKGNEVRR